MGRQELCIGFAHLEVRRSSLDLHIEPVGMYIIISIWSPSNYLTKSHWAMGKGKRWLAGDGDFVLSDLFQVITISWTPRNGALVTMVFNKGII